MTMKVTSLKLTVTGSSIEPSTINLVQQCCCGGHHVIEEMDQCIECGGWMCMGADCDCPCPVAEYDEG